MYIVYFRRKKRKICGRAPHLADTAHIVSVYRGQGGTGPEAGQGRGKAGLPLLLQAGGRRGRGGYGGRGGVTGGGVGGAEAWRVQHRRVAPPQDKLVNLQPGLPALDFLQ